MAPWTTGQRMQPQPPGRVPPANLAQNFAQKRTWGQDSSAAAGGPIKKPTIATGAIGGSSLPAITVSSMSKNDDIGIQTLVGDYADKGSNHGKKYYQKVQKIPGHEDINVFLYYWDARDGPDFSGWWFGDSLGGSQVWARNPTHGPLPPRIGWKIPWDAPKAEPGILLVDPFRSTTPSAGSLTGTAAASSARPMGNTANNTIGANSVVAKIKSASGQVDAAEKAANDALNNARELLAASEGENVLKEAQELLQQQATALTEVQKDVAKLLSEVGRGGVGSAELAKLPPRVRSVQSSVNAELAKVKAQYVKEVQAASSAKRAAETAAQQKKLAEQQKEQEEKDTKELLDTLPASMDLVCTAEDVVESVAIMAAPLIADPPDDQGDSLKRSMDEIEAASVDGQNKITEARKQINLKLQGARKYAPETRKKALAEFSSMQQKLTEAQKKLNPFKTFRKDFQQHVEAKKALQTVAEKLSAAELEVEKATMISSAADQGQMSEDEVNAAEKLVHPAQQGITSAMQVVEQKLRQSQAQADSVLKEELTQLKNRGQASRTKLEGVVNVIRRQREGLAAQKNIELASEKADRAEEALLKCEIAEMPYLKGIEVLPPDESAKAISECEAAAAQTEALINQTKNFIRSKLADTKRYTKDLMTVITEQLTEVQTRVDASAKKLEKFKGETNERKMASLMAEVVEATMAAESKGQIFKEAVELFAKENLDEVSIEALKEAGQKAPTAEKEASVACLEARKLLGAKQKEARGNDATQALAKLSTRLNTAQQELSKWRKIAITGDKVIKGKELVAEEGEKIAQAEIEIEKVEKMVNPDEGETLSDTAIQEMDAMVASAQKVLKASQRSIDAHIPGAVLTLKTSLQKLSEQSKKALERLTAGLEKIKDQRERVLSEVYVKEGQAKTDAVEEAIEKVNDAELPFLKGIEVLPLQEATGTIKESEAAAVALQQAISAARTYIASKNLEVRNFDESVSKSVGEEFSKLTERVNAAASKLAQFRKDTDGRKKTAQMQEAGEKIATLESEVKKLVDDVAPLSKLPKEKKIKEDKVDGTEEGKDGSNEEQKEEAMETMSEEETAELCEKLSAQLKEVQTKAEDARSFLATRQKEARSSAGQFETIQKLQARLSAASAELNKTKKIVSEREQKFVARKILSEVNEKVAEAVEEARKATEVCAPLLEQGGEEFLVSASVQILASVLRDYMKDKELTEAMLLEQMDGSSAETFVAYLEKLPEVTEREEVMFTAERRQAIFKHIDADNDGSISLAEFKEMFRRRYICMRGISVTDCFDIGQSKTVSKIEANDVMEALGNPKKDESTGMMRLECKNVETGVSGFVTMQGNQGTTYLEAITPFTAFSTRMDKAIDDSMQATIKILTFLRSKISELGSAGSYGPLAEARTEIAKLRPKATTAETNLKTLKAKVANAKKDFARKEQSEKNAHIEARERKAAAVFLTVAAEKMEAVESALKSLEEAAAPVTSLASAALKDFPTPATVLGEVESRQAATTVILDEARTCIKEQIEKVAKEIGKEVKGPMAEAKRDLQKMSMKVDVAARKRTNVTDSLRKACKAIVTKRHAEVSARLRSEVQKRNITIEGFFTELAGAGEDRVSEAAFCSHLASIEGLEIPAEQATLLCRQIENGGIGKRRFCSFLQEYFVVVKSIAITNDFDISKAKTIRKAEIDEVIEILEGPKTDEKIGLTRIRGKSLTDITEGWITVMGNQGTPFLQEVEKPYICCAEETPMERSFRSDGEGSVLVRNLEKDEVLEVIEGPRKDAVSSGLRARGKASLDGQMGWFTVKDKTGIAFAAAEGKYYTCAAPVAITDVLDIKSCKVVRKLAVGEMFLLQEGPVEEKEAGITRVKGKSLKDDKEGWITTKGSAGTVYAEASSKHYTIMQDVPLQKKFPTAGSEEIRVLAKGEAVQVIEGPKEETFPPEVRLKGRAQSDGATGWFTIKGDNFKPWSPYYTCSKATPIHEAQNAEEGKVVRQLEVSEVVELLEGPVQEDKEQRIKVRAEKDGIVGWVTLKDGEGKLNLRS